jgi:hypothetical protein
MIATVKDLEQKQRAFMTSPNTQEEQATKGQTADAENMKFIQLINDIKVTWSPRTLCSCPSPPN